jgi:hypothetical protein
VISQDVGHRVEPTTVDRLMTSSYGSTKPAKKRTKHPRFHNPRNIGLILLRVFLSWCSGFALFEDWVRSPGIPLSFARVVHRYF